MTMIFPYFPGAMLLRANVTVPQGMLEFIATLPVHLDIMDKTARINVTARTEQLATT